MKNAGFVPGITWPAVPPIMGQICSLHLPHENQEHVISFIPYTSFKLLPLDLIIAVIWGLIIFVCFVNSPSNSMVKTKHSRHLIDQLVFLGSVPPKPSLPVLHGSPHGITSASAPLPASAWMLSASVWF